MKTKLILGSFLALVSIGQAQTWGGSTSVAGNTYRTGNVGIGTTSPANKLDISTTVPSDGLRIQQTNYGACGITMDNQTTGGKNWSLFSLGNGDAAGAGNFSIFHNVTSYSGHHRLFIQGSTGNVGIGTTNPVNGRLEVQETTTTNAIAGVFQKSGFNNVQNRGIYVTADNGTFNWAGTFIAGSIAGSTNSQNLGVYAATSYPYRSVDWAGYFEGNVRITNDLSVGGIGTIPGGVWSSSDRKLKKDIHPIDNSINILMKLQPKTYLFDQESSGGLLLPNTQQYGFIAQELQEIIPSLVNETTRPAILDSKGNILKEEFKYLSVKYDGIIPFLVKGFQEQQKTIELQSLVNSDLQKQLNETKELIKALSDKSTGINTINQIETGFQMSQNEPNPFTHETIVKYTLPQNVSNAFIAIYDLTGKQITTFQIQEKGSASMLITSEKLAAGIYIYSIVADGKVIDSKRMIVAEK